MENKIDFLKQFEKGIQLENLTKEQLELVKNILKDFK
jgi:hypothetical protein